MLASFEPKMHTLNPILVRPQISATAGKSRSASWVAYGLFLLLVTILYVRPAEIFPALEGTPIYEWVILVTLLCTATSFVSQWTPRSLVRRPITAGIVGFLVAIMLSHLIHMRLRFAFESGFVFFKAVVLYMLLVGNVNTLT